MNKYILGNLEWFSFLGLVSLAVLIARHTGVWDETIASLLDSGSAVQRVQATAFAIIGKAALPAFFVSVVPTALWLDQERQRSRIIWLMSKTKNHWWGPSGKAIVSLTLTGLILAVHLTVETIGNVELARDALGLQPEKGYSLLTYAVIHAGWYHLGGNAITLFLLGPVTERLIGKFWFIFSIALLVFIGAATSVRLTPEHFGSGENPVGLSTMTLALITVGAYVLAEKLFRLMQQHPPQWRLIERFLGKCSMWKQLTAVLASAVCCALLIYDALDTSTGPVLIGHTTALLGGTAIAAVHAIYSGKSKTERVYDTGGI